VAAALIAAAVGVASRTAVHADPLDEFGFGSRGTAMAGALTAEARGAAAAHYNPAGTALARHPGVLLGYGLGAMGLELNGADARVLDARGGSFGLALPARVGEITTAFGFALYIPDQFLARIQLVPASEPHFVLLDNDPHRMVVEPSLSLRIGDVLALGAGVSIFTDAAGNGVTFDVGVVAGEKVGESALDVELPLRFAPHVGALYTPHERLRVGATYRGELGLDLALDILANVDVANVVTGDALVSVRAANYFTPRRVSVGVALEPLAELTLSAEAQWQDYSSHPGAVTDLRVLVNLDTAPPLVGGALPAAEFEDTITARVGAEWRLGGDRTRYAIRTGYAYIPTPVSEQTGLTSLADNDRHVMCAGLGVVLADWAPILTRPIGLHLGAQWHQLARQLTQKDPERYPGDAFSSAGRIVYLGSSLEVAF
jgi:long-chain fatty acid transport protein